MLVVNEWTKKTRSMHTEKYYLILKKNELLSYVEKRWKWKTAHELTLVT